MLADEKQHKLVERLEESAQKVTTPLRRWENSLERPVILFVLPIFALVNAGIPVDYNILTTVFGENLSWGILIGLVVGKPLGITVLPFPISLAWQCLAVLGSLCRFLSPV